MSTVLFPSGGWADAWVRLANTDERFRLAGRGWGGSGGRAVGAGLAFSGPPLYLRLDGRDGIWNQHWWGADPHLLNGTTFTIYAEYLVWKLVIRQDLDPLRGFVTGQLRVRGQLSSVLRWYRALTRM